MCWQRGAIKLERYWDLRFTDKSQGSEHEIVDELDSLLFDTVRMHLLSDVRVGAFLSGGMVEPDLGDDREGEQRGGPGVLDRRQGGGL